VPYNVRCSYSEKKISDLRMREKMLYWHRQQKIQTTSVSFRANALNRKISRFAKTNCLPPTSMKCFAARPDLGAATHSSHRTQNMRQKLSPSTGDNCAHSDLQIISVKFITVEDKTTNNNKFISKWIRVFNNTAIMIVLLHVINDPVYSS